MDHNDIRHRLSEHLDETLTPDEKASVEEHLKICPDCSNALMELRKTIEHIRKVEEAEPPAWMTQKIMARVRAEEEKKKQGLFHRVFFPLHVKLPLETIGVLFIAVTVYFVVQDVQKTNQPFPEAPVQTYSLESSPTGGAAQDKAADADRSLQSKKEVAREQGYKALDMKQAYGKPKPPVRASAPEAIGPAGGQRALQYEPSLGLTEQAASESMRNQEPTKEFSDQEAVPQAPAAAMAKRKTAGIASEEMRAATASAETSGKQILTLAVSDVDQAAARVEGIVKEYGGKIIRKEPAAADGALSLTVTMDAASRNQFIDRLNILGELRDKDAVEIRREVIEIRIVKQVQ